MEQFDACFGVELNDHEIARFEAASSLGEHVIRVDRFVIIASSGHQWQNVAMVVAKVQYPPSLHFENRCFNRVAVPGDFRVQRKLGSSCLTELLAHEAAHYAERNVGSHHTDTFDAFIGAGKCVDCDK